jgi:polygalacturonase
VNVAVTGRGVLTTSNYEAWRKAYPAAYEGYLKARKGIVSTGGDESGSANGPNWDRLLSALQAKRPVSEQEYRAAAGELRPSFLCFMNARNVLVEGVRIIGAPIFVVHLLYTENAVVRNIMVETYPGPHTNGIVADYCRFVRISDSYIDTGDDGIVLKAGKDADGLRVNRPTENVTITNCTVHRAHGAVAIGSETSGSIRNVVAGNITAVGTDNGIRLKSRRGRGGVVEDVRFDNWTMKNVGTGIVVTSNYIMGGEKRHRKRREQEGHRYRRPAGDADHDPASDRYHRFRTGGAHRTIHRRIGIAWCAGGRGARSGVLREQTLRMRSSTIWLPENRLPECRFCGSQGLRERS